MISWQVSVDGNDYVVSVERGPNEKDFIRVNGRLAGAPMTADELECEVSLGGAPYVIRREGDSFQLYPEETNRSSDPPVRKPRKPRILKNLVRAGLAFLMIVNLLAAVAIFDQYLAEDRVHKLLQELHTASEMGMLPAMALWSGKRVSLDGMSKISKDFDHWRIESDLYRKQFKRYRITQSELAWSGTTPTVLVTFYLDRNLYTVRVPRDAPMTWEGTPPQHVDVIEPPPVRKPRVPGPPTKLTFEVLPPPPPDPNARTTAKPGSMITFLPRGNALGRVFIMRPGEHAIHIRAFTTTTFEQPAVTYIHIEAAALMPGGTNGYVTIDGGKRSLGIGTFVPKRDPDATGIQFEASLDDTGCTATGGTLQILALDYDMGVRNNSTGMRPVYLKHLDARYAVECGGRYVSTGEIHIIGETH